MLSLCQKERGRKSFRTTKEQAKNKERTRNNQRELWEGQNKEQQGSQETLPWSTINAGFSYTNMPSKASGKSLIQWFYLGNMHDDTSCVLDVINAMSHLLKCIVALFVQYTFS